MKKKRSSKKRVTFKIVKAGRVANGTPIMRLAASDEPRSVKVKLDAETKSEIREQVASHLDMMCIAQGELKSLFPLIVSYGAFVRKKTDMAWAYGATEEIETALRSAIDGVEKIQRDLAARLKSLDAPRRKSATNVKAGEGAVSQT